MKIRNLNFCPLLLIIFLLNSSASRDSKADTKSISNINIVTEHSDAMVKPNDFAAVITPTPSLLPTYSSIREQIFLPLCVSCHSHGGAAENVILDNYEILLNSPRDLVLPRDSETSGLVMVLTRTDSKQMPPLNSGASSLTSDEIATVKRWIDEGALNN